jgi:drug/metabolite transporter (DMT)-like permease
MLALSAFIGGIVLPVTAGGWAGFVLSNVLFAVAVIGFYASISMAGAGPATFFLNLEPIVVVGAGYVLLDQLVSLWQMLGITIVVVALIYASRAPGDRERAAPTAPASSA